jgi:predicted metal-dependent phosphoesterase TrpH
VDVVPGAEISCRHDGVSLHLLAYLFDPMHPPLAQALDDLRASRFGRAEAMVRLLEADGLPVTWGQVQSLARGAVGRPHVALALIEAGLVGSIDEAFTPEWIGTGGRYWQGKLELDVLDAISLVRAAGGVTVFAHPAAAARGRIVPPEAIVHMAAAGLAGLEVSHPDHDSRQQQEMASVAAELGLLATGASDFHGDNKAVQLGAHLTPEAVYDELVARASGAAVLRRA